MDILELTLYTHNLIAVRNFYGNELELDLIDHTGQELLFKVGSTRLRFKAVSGSKPYYHFAFNIPPHLLMEAQKWLKGHAQTITWQGKELVDFPNWNAQSLYFFDPVGNILEFIARQELPINGRTDFDSDCILNISEIGIIADPVFAMREKLEQSFGLQVFNRQPPTNEFCPMGNDNGLLILVTEHRNWFPTAIPCKPFPLEILFSNDGGQTAHLLKT